MTRVFLGLGSNIGCKAGNIRRAFNLLSKEECIHNLDLSSFYKSDPVGELDQDWFVNVVVRLETELTVLELLDVCRRVEAQLKRVRVKRWGPRIIDLDILYFGDETIEEECLQVPHPRIEERAFVLDPLLELEPEFTFRGRRLRECRERVAGQRIERMKPVVAVVGASEKPDRFSNRAQRLLMEEGYAVAAVAPHGDTILGAPVLASLLDCVEPVDTVTLYVGSARVESVLESVLETCPRRVVFNPGTENATARQRLDEAGVETVEDCTLVMLRSGVF